MRYLGRELRRLYMVKCYRGDPDANKPRYEKLAVIGFNSVDVIRSCGGKHVAEEPINLHYVTWPDANGQMFRIDDPADGPIGDPVQADIIPHQPQESSDEE